MSLFSSEYDYQKGSPPLLIAMHSNEAPRNVRSLAKIVGFAVESRERRINPFLDECIGDYVLIEKALTS
jgi:hypothetical protein